MRLKGLFESAMVCLQWTRSEGWQIFACGRRQEAAVEVCDRLQSFASFRRRTTVAASRPV